jgi:hypothetical protein
VTALLDADDRRKIRFLAAVSVQWRRHQGQDEGTIRRGALDVAGKAIAKHVDDLVEQETWFAELAKAIDREITRTGDKPRGRGPKG